MLFIDMLMWLVIGCLIWLRLFVEMSLSLVIVLLLRMSVRWARVLFLVVPSVLLYKWIRPPIGEVK